MGVLDVLGTVEEGKLADLVVVADSPLENISNIRKTVMVLKGGVIVDLDGQLGTASYWDYFGAMELPEGFLAEAEKAAGFDRGDNIANGAQLIKFLGSRMPPEELIAGIDEAHRHGIPVTVHAGDRTTRIAVMAGAESIEHGNDLSDDTIRMMAEAGTFLDPTIQCNLSTEFIAERERLIKEAGYVDPPEVIEGRVRVSHADERTPEHANLARDA